MSWAFSSNEASKAVSEEGALQRWHDRGMHGVYRGAQLPCLQTSLHPCMHMAAWAVRCTCKCNLQCYLVVLGQQIYQLSRLWGRHPGDENSGLAHLELQSLEAHGAFPTSLSPLHDALKVVAMPANRLDVLRPCLDIGSWGQIIRRWMILPP